jgi:hypothetical protein
MSRCAWAAVSAYEQSNNKPSNLQQDPGTASG